MGDMSQAEMEDRARNPVLYVDIDCVECGKLMAMSNANKRDGRNLCQTCVDRYDFKKSGKKAPVIENLLNSIAKQMSGMNRDEASDKQLCVVCGKDASKFKDALSKREYEISKMCGKCQDKIFSC